MKTTQLQMIPAVEIVTLKRNPQYLTPKQMDSLKASMKRDGFVAPILVRQLKSGRFEVISGNHRFMASQELGMAEVPAVISKMTDKEAKRLAVNLNTIHGTPNAELLAPFLAEMDDDVLKDIHFEDDALADLLAFDKHLEQRLAELQPPDAMDRPSPQHSNAVCRCEKCGTTHVKKKTKQANETAKV